VPEVIGASTAFQVTARDQRAGQLADALDREPECSCHVGYGISFHSRRGQHEQVVFRNSEAGRRKARNNLLADVAFRVTNSGCARHGQTHAVSLWADAWMVKSRLI
jgi:hypothetical protein